MTPWPVRGDQRERKLDAAVAQGRKMEPWELRRERYLIQVGRAAELIDEEKAAARRKLEQSAGGFPRRRRD